MFAVRDEDAALDIVQDAMLKLTEKYAAKPAAELPMLFQRILQNTIHDHFRRQKVRNTWTTLLSAFGKGDEKDDDYDILETLSAKSDSNATVDPAKQFEQGQIVGMIEQALMRLPARQREAFLLRYWEETGRGGNRCRNGLFRRQCEDALLPRRPCPGRDAQGQGAKSLIRPMTTHDDNFAKKLTGYLDAGAAELKAGTVYRLQKARAAALARLAEPAGVRASESRLAHAFAGVRRIGDGRRQEPLDQRPRCGSESPSSWRPRSDTSNGRPTSK